MTAAASPDNKMASMEEMPLLLTTVTPGYETTSLLSTIHAISLVDIGSDKFMQSYCVNLERLSIQAHGTAGLVTRNKSREVVMNNMNNNNQGGINIGTIDTNEEEEEYIVEAILESPHVLESMVKTLLALELWRTHVLFRRGEQLLLHGDNENVSHENDNDADADGNFDDDDEEEIEISKTNSNSQNNKSTNNRTANNSSSNNNRTTNKKGLAHKLASNGNALRVAFIVHAETTIVSLLNLVFYRGIPHGLLDGGGSSSVGGDDLLLSLIDYCARQLIFLGTPPSSNHAIHRQKHPLPTPQLSTHLLQRSRIDELRDSVLDSSYQTAIASVALSRYFCEHVQDLGPSLVSRMMEVHDFPLLMIPLIEEPPWTRRRSSSSVNNDNNNNNNNKMVWEKIDEHNQWHPVPPTNLLHLTKFEGQPWLALYHLTSSKPCRESYGLDEYRKSQLMRLRRYIHEALMDQLPILGEVARYLDELSIVGVPPSGQGVYRPNSNASSSGLLLQRVDVVRELIVGKKRIISRDNGGGGGGRITNNDEEEECYWEDIAQCQWNDIFSLVTDSKDGELRRIANEVYGGSELMNGVRAAFKDLPQSNTTNADVDADASLELSEEDKWKIPLSRPLEKVTLHLVDTGNKSLGVFELMPGCNNNGGTITETPLGQFRRIKLSISQTSGDGEAIHPHAKASANIHFQKDSSSPTSNYAEEGAIILSTNSISLPTMQHRPTPENYDEVGISLAPDLFPSKEWRQLGDLQGRNVVLQLGFRRISRGVVPVGCSLLRGYVLSQAFFSQPIV